MTQKNHALWLVNQSTLIRRGGAVLRIVGLDDHQFGREDLQLAVQESKRVDVSGTG